MLTPEMFSELKPYSIGMVAENKKLKNDRGGFNHVLEVTPIEDLPMLDGEVKSGIVSSTVSLSDQEGGESQIKVSTSNSVEATWLPLGSSNRFTPPDVRRGAVVMLYRWADEDRFFWTTLFDDLKLRKLETVVYGWSGTMKENAEVNGDNYYFMEVSTHKGVVNFHTSKANGEFCSVDIQLNVKDGCFQLRDDTGHIFIINFKEKQMAMENPDGTSFEINRKNLTINVPETYTVNAKNMVVKVAQSIVTKATNVALTASAGIQESAKSITIHGKASVSITSPATTIV